MGASARPQLQPQTTLRFGGFKVQIVVCCPSSRGAVGTFPSTLEYDEIVHLPLDASSLHRRHPLALREFLVDLLVGVFGLLETILPASCFTHSVPGI